MIQSVGDDMKMTGVGVLFGLCLMILVPFLSKSISFWSQCVKPVSLFLRVSVSIASSSKSLIAKTRAQSTNSKIAFARVFDNSPRTLRQEKTWETIKLYFVDYKFMWWPFGDWPAADLQSRQSRQSKESSLIFVLKLFLGWLWWPFIKWPVKDLQIWGGQ